MHRHRMSVLGVAVAVVAALVVAACGSSKKSASTGAPAKAGGTVVETMGTAPDYLDPNQTYTTQGYEPTYVVYTPLLTYARPRPAPEGRSNEPTLATVSLAGLSEVPGNPLGSPKPPVWTSRAGLCTVGGSELPEAKLLVTTSFFLGSTGFTTSADAKVLVTISFFGTGTGGAGTLATSTGLGSGLGGSTLDGSIFGGSTFGGSGVTSLGGGVNFASTLGGGAVIFGTTLGL